MNQGSVNLSIVTPCYNEEQVILKFYDEICKYLSNESLVNQFEIVFVDDGSSDSTLAILTKLMRSDDKVRAVALSRNFGHQIALTAGIDHAKYNTVIMMDSDLQHPPSLIPKMIAKHLEGFDVVTAVRKDTLDASAFKKFSSSAFYHFINLMSDVRIEPGAADFSLLSGEALAALKGLKERHRFLRGLVAWIGYNRVFVEYNAPARFAGESKYSLLTMMNLASDAIAGFSSAPIKVASRIGLAITAVGMLYLMYVLFRVLAIGDVTPGWASVIGVILVLGGAQLIFIGLIGSYLARVYDETKGRPIYLTRNIDSE